MAYNWWLLICEASAMPSDLTVLTDFFLVAVHGCREDGFLTGARLRCAWVRRGLIVLWPLMLSRYCDSLIHSLSTPGNSTEKLARLADWVV